MFAENPSPLPDATTDAMVDFLRVDLAWMWGLRASQKSAPLKCISGTFVDQLWCDNYLRHGREAALHGVQLLTVH